MSLVVRGYVYSFVSFNIEFCMHFVTFVEDNSCFTEILRMSLKFYIYYVRIYCVMFYYFYYCLLRFSSFIVIYVYENIFSCECMSHFNICMCFVLIFRFCMSFVKIFQLCTCIMFNFSWRFVCVIINFGWMFTQFFTYLYKNVLS